ncbi:MAG: ThuA domain-containing protein [Cyclobacteriaceae bacterium]
MNLLLLCRYLFFFILMAGSSLSFAQQTGKVLIVHDEPPQVEVLADFLRNEGKLEVALVEQDALPASLSDYQAVLGFIHGKLELSTEEAIIQYTEQGGKFVCLHHSISSGKALNPHFFDFLGIQLDHPEFSPHPVKPGEGYGWYHDGKNGITLRLVNLHPSHYITNHKVEWGAPISYASSDGPSVEKKYPSIALPKTEVYMNHKFTDGREKTVLAGFKYLDPRNGEMFMQDRAVWYKAYGEGMIFYFMPGETAADYENRNIAQMILNAIEWKP